MPIALIWIGAGLGVLFLAGKAAEDVGEAVDNAGSGSLKLAGAAALGVGAWIAFKKAG